MTALTEVGEEGLRKMMASSDRHCLSAGDILELLDGNNSEFEGFSDDDSDEDFIPENDIVSNDVSSDSEDDIPLANICPPRDPPATSSRQSYRWRKQDFIPPDTQFTGDPVPIPDKIRTPLEYFQQFISKEMVESLAENTNVFAIQKNGVPIKTNSKEIEQVIGMNLRMGLVNMPGKRMYWEEATRYGPVADVMGRNRFLQLLTVLHFVNNNEVPEEQKSDKLWKIRPWLEEFRKNCLNLTPEEHNSVDEQMIPFKGKFSPVKQYMRNKPHKWGFKVWCRTGSSGLLYDFDVYQGKSGVQLDTENHQSLGVSGGVVAKLASTLPGGQNFKITADNFFTSVALICQLQQRGIHYTGTVRLPRLPGCQMKTEKDLKKEGRGSFDFRVEATHNIVAVRWYDNRAVTLVSSYVGPEPTDMVKRWERKTKSHTEVPRPNIVQKYNRFMGGVDFLDSLIAKYKYQMKGKRWYLYIFWHVIVLSVAQAWLVYRRDAQLLQIPKKAQMNHRRFQADIASSLVLVNTKKRGRPSEVKSVNPNPPRRIRTNPPADVRRDSFGHWPIKVAKRGRCKHCPKGYTDTICEKCDVLLCFNEKRNCFRLYHN